jgi:hypothetical protein
MVVVFLYTDKASVDPDPAFILRSIMLFANGIDMNADKKSPRDPGAFAC